MIFDSDSIKIKNINISHENNGEYYINLTMLLEDKEKYIARLKLPINEKGVSTYTDSYWVGGILKEEKYIDLGFGKLLCVNEWYDDIEEKVDENNEKDVNDMEKFSIVSPSIDKYKLSSKIEEFRTAKKYDPYIFMNQKSMVELMLNTNDDPASYGYYDKCKIFCDSTLDYGEVELR